VTGWSSIMRSVLTHQEHHQSLGMMNFLQLAAPVAALEEEEDEYEEEYEEEDEVEEAEVLEDWAADDQPQQAPLEDELTEEEFAQAMGE